MSKPYLHRGMIIGEFHQIIKKNNTLKSPFGGLGGLIINI
ncbi:hypothetical protein LX69_01034 [Breznakibacter xylanolyticus]|uniref:Uncharacterized protein n=1 Tax=Breznakibacter xylanolyticus TaxID=990 RepID=A0A2W7NDY4_9BACT|nr:hypothetical protein LX69_01034 [Breznakibacter xylanolyticus]